MKSSFWFALLLFPALALPTVAQNKKPGKFKLPTALLGVWGDDEEACKGEAIEAENRLEVEQDGLALYVSYFAVRAWQKQRGGYSGRAKLAQEGEGKPEPGTYLVALTQLPDGKLEFKVNRDPARIFVKCPEGTRIR